MRERVIAVETLLPDRYAGGEGSSMSTDASPTQTGGVNDQVKGLALYQTVRFVDQLFDFRELNAVLEL